MKLDIRLPIGLLFSICGLLLLLFGALSNHHTHVGSSHEVTYPIDSTSDEAGNALRLVKAAAALVGLSVELLFQLVERIVANVSLRSQLKEELASRGNRAPMNVVMVRIRSVRIASITVGPAQVSGEFMPDHPSRVRRVAVQGSERCLHDALTCSRDLSFNQVVVVDSKHSQQGPERQALDDQRAEHD